ncbi:MarR family winged helix-turn-helix transcriptional regulator [Solicola gregarius]|uniref:MarR family transcriptional regulator n=1 Tax=Solicola gregarius TaxID=2908642 RepID=A0AA46TGC4_9ACTN|nr:MarR family transcriptional regulator [Solicola gregarius]UYM04683.1 MarR family transcriptional regulator [Solicola gregarius]
MPQRTSRPAALAEATEVLDSLLLAWRRMTPDSTLSRTAASTLGALYRLGPLRLTTLAQHEAVTQPAMTGLVGRLESQGLVNRTPDPSDGRAVIIGLTPAGEALVDERRRQYAATIADMLGTLEPHDFDLLIDALPALQRLADATHAQTFQPKEDPR